MTASKARPRARKPLSARRLQYGEINWSGLNFSAEQFATVTHIDKAAWTEEMQLHTAHFDQLAYGMPQALLDTKEGIGRPFGLLNFK